MVKTKPIAHMRINLRFVLLLFLVVAFLWTGTASAQASLNFDGSNDYVRIPNSVSTASAFTIAFWMKTTQTGPGSGGSQWYEGLGLVDAEIAGTANDFGISLVGTKVAFGIGNPDKTIFSTSNVNTGNWVHVAAVWDGNTPGMKLYINGILEASATGNVSAFQRNAPPAIMLGSIITVLGAFNIPKNCYNGNIAGLRIWNIALANPKDNITCSLAPTAGLMANYIFDDGVANGTNTGVTTIADASGNNNTGTLINFALMGNTSNFTDNVVYPATAVTITSNSTNPYDGYHIIFTAGTTFVGSDCSYQWYKNGSPITGATDATYATTTLADNDQIYCIISTSTACTAATNYQSNTVTLHSRPLHTWYVKPGASGGGTSWDDAGDLQTMINLAYSNSDSRGGDSVFVAAGTYTPATNMSYSMKEGVKILGGFPATGNPSYADRDYITNTTVLQGYLESDQFGRTTNRVINNNNNGLTAAAVLDGFTITRGALVGSNAHGAGIYNNNVSPTIQNCIITNNTTINNGGGVYNVYGRPAFINCTFSLNKNETKGGGMSNYYSNAIVTNCTFSDNTSYGSTGPTEGGGGMHNENSNPVITNCTFSGNESFNGGAINNWSASPQIINCRLLNNKGSQFGGAVYSNNYSAPVFTDCVFAYNTSGFGGAVYNYTSNAWFTNSVFHGNLGSQAGGAIANEAQSKNYITNCTFTKNSVTANGGSGRAIRSDFHCDLLIKNSVFYGNTGVGELSPANAQRNITVFVTSAIEIGHSGAEAHVSNSLIEGWDGSGSPGYTGLTNDGGNIHVYSPLLFADMDAPEGADGIWGTDDDGLQLYPTSFLIGRGNNDAVAVNTDVAGQPRIQNGKVDMGAYESPYNRCGLTINIPEIKHIKCNGGNDGSITLEVSGGSGSFQYNWLQLGGNTATASGLTAGNYTCVITDTDNSCVTDTTITISQPDVLAATIVQENNNCYGNHNGSITINVSGGVVPYTYLWSNGATTASIAHLAAGNYTCTITDKNGCSIVKNITITQPDELIAYISPTPIGGSITTGTATVKVSGGTAPYTYQWSNGATTATITGLSAGIYTCTITDAGYCGATVNQSIAIEQLPSNTVTLYVDSGAVSPGSGSTWNNALKTLNDALVIAGQLGNVSNIWVAKGTYYPTGLQSGTDRNAAFVLPQHGIKLYGGFDPAHGITDINNRIIPNTGVTLGTVLSGNIGTANTNSDNSFHVMVIAGATADSTIVDGFTLTHANGNIGGNYTYNSIAMASNTGGGMALYNNSNQTLIRNCSFTNNISNQGAGLFTSAASPVVQNCFIQGNTATDNGGAMSNFNTSAPTSINVLMAGNKAGYGGAIFAQNSNNTLINCTIAGNYAINDGGGINSKGSANTTIKNSIVYGNATGGYDPNLRNEEGGNANLAYSLIEDSAGTWQPSFGTDNGNNTFLNPDFVEAVAATNQNTPHTSGNYSLQQGSNAVGVGNNSFILQNVVTDIANTTRIQQERVDMGAYESSYAPCGFTAIVATLNPVSCNGDNNGSATMSVSGGSSNYQYSWSNGINGATVTNLSAGDYICTITDMGSGCVTAITITITQPEELVAATSQENSNCYGSANGSAAITSVSGGVAPYTYNWSNGETTAAIAHLAAGDYTCTITDKNGCTVTKHVTLTQPEALVTYVSQISTGGEVTATISTKGGIPPYTYNWGNGATTATVSGLSGGTYTYTVTDASLCATVQQSVVITPLPANVTTLYVDSSAVNPGNGSSWSNALKTLSDALVVADQQSNINSIRVAKGTYYPTGTQNATDRSRTFLIPQRGGIKIYGGYNSSSGTRDIVNNPTLLSGDIGTAKNNSDNSYHVMVIANIANTADSVVVDGLTIKEGNAGGFNGPKAYNGTNINQFDGGGICIVSSASRKIEIRNCTVKANEAGNYGGGIYIDNASPTIKYSRMESNSASFFAMGGGMVNINNASPYIAHCTFVGNIASYGGGMLNITGSSPYITHCVFVSNTGGFMGGGMLNMDNSSPVAINCTFTGNVVDASSGAGGGIYNENSSLVITNCTIAGNITTGAYSSGGGIRSRTSSLTITNSIAFGNYPYDVDIYNDGGNTTISHSIVQSIIGYNGGSTGNSTANPQFVNAPSAFSAPFTGGDYRLQSSSSAINAGTSDTTGLNLPITDLAGNLRVQNGRIDMGAYEIYVEGTLPVSLLDFTAKAEGNYVKLQWQTVNEVNHKRFEIYRKSEEGEFVKIGEVLASTFSNSISHSYTYIDKTPQNGTNYYKLVQIDKDGTTTDLGVRVLNFGLPTSDVQLYPNPTTDKITIKFENGIFNQLQLVDVNGRVLQSIGVNKAENSKQVSLASYPAEIYIIKLSGSGITETRKVVKN